jgi:predicted nucleotidyltransferase
MPAPTLQEELRAIVETAPADVVAVYLYGSRARGTASSGSDIDIGVLLKGVPPSRLRSTARTIESDIEKTVHIPAEAVVLNTASPDLIHRVLRDGILLLDRDRAARIRFEIQARNEYFDLAPIRRLYRRIPA